MRMTRRECTGLLAMAALARAQSSPIVKPKVLREGDAVALITPATFVADPESLEMALETMRFFGLKPKLSPNVRKRTGYMGGSIDDRLTDLHAAFADPSVKGVFCIRGGYGSGQLLDKIDYDLIRRNPKVFAGYSDITALHLAIHQKTGLVTFHGPVPVSKFTAYSQESFRKALLSTQPIGSLTNPQESNTLRPSHRLRAVGKGTARGRLAGGNLSLISALMGTPYEIDTRGKLFFTEDVEEPPYSLDRMLTQLRLAGKLQAAAGIVWGECSKCEGKAFDAGFSVGEVVDSILGGLNKPVLSGLTIGHTDDQLTLPLGVQATLDADKGTLTIEESAVVA
jgi:muramoyltetrapeptide carboxypeptidase